MSSTPTPIPTPTPGVPASIPIVTDADAEIADLRAELDRKTAENERMKAEFYHHLDVKVKERMEEARELILKANPSKKKKVEVAKPESFDGSESKLEGFLQQLRLLFWAEPDVYADEDSRITSALSYMKQGSAQAWARRFMEHFHKNSGSYSMSWSSFETQLKESFGAADPTVNAVDKIRNLQQGSMTADEYIVAFEEHEANTKWDDKALKDQFEQGLKPGLVASIYRLQEMPKDLAGWKTWARRLDRQWRQYEEKQRLNKQAKASTTKEPTKDETKKTTAKQTVLHQSEGVPTRRDATGLIFGGRGQPMDLDEARRKGLCFRCGRQGHIGRDCPDKKRADVRRMFSALDEDQIDELKKMVVSEEDFPSGPQ